MGDGFLMFALGQLILVPFQFTLFALQFLAHDVNFAVVAGGDFLRFGFVFGFSRFHAHGTEFICSNLRASVDCQIFIGAHGYGLVLIEPVHKILLHFAHELQICQRRQCVCKLR